MIAPASRSRRTISESAAAGSVKPSVPWVLTSPATSTSFLIAIGTPSSGRSSPALSLASACSASSSAFSAQHLAKGVQLGVEAGDPVEAQLDQLGRGDLTRTDHLRLPRGAGEGDVLVGDRCAPLHGRHRIGVAAAPLEGEILEVRRFPKAMVRKSASRRPGRGNCELRRAAAWARHVEAAAETAGLTSAAISQRVGTKRLHRVHRGVYTVGYPTERSRGAMDGRGARLRPLRRPQSSLGGCAVGAAAADGRAGRRLRPLAERPQAPPRNSRPPPPLALSSDR